MTAQPRKRQPRGVETGGQFATESKQESGVSLELPSYKSKDSDGFPMVACNKCQGTGKSSQYSSTLHHSECFKCSGSGVMPDGVYVARAVKALATARLNAARPRVTEIQKGDVVSLIIKGRYNYKSVANVIVSLRHPVKKVQAGRGKSDVTAYHSRITFTDGTHVDLTSDTILARRGSNLDMQPFHMIAAGKRVDPELISHPKLMPHNT